MSEQSGSTGTGARGRPVRRLALLAGTVIGLVIVVGVLGRIQTDRAADQTVGIATAAPLVTVATARREDTPHIVMLPGETQSFDYAAIYPRATGYIAERRVDIGSRVHKGDLLVRISAPDTDAQLVQATATVAQLEAAVIQAQTSLKSAIDTKNLADITSHRSTVLAGQGWDPQQIKDNNVASRQVSHQSVTAAEAGIAVANANLQAAQASAQRLQALVGFERVTAPFDGVITARSTDIGDLVQADVISSGTPMFTESADDVLRADVYVPQSEAVGVRDGIAAKVTVPEMPGRVFAATVSRSAVAVADASRSMLTEIDIPNAAHLLRPGLFVTIGFQVPRDHSNVIVPDSAVIFDEHGLHVAVVENGQVHLHDVTIEKDMGVDAELSSGLQGGEQVVVNPPSTLADGERVTVPPATA